MKRVFAVLAAAAMSTSFFSCASKVSQPFDVSKDDGKVQTIKEVSSEFEGFYTNGEYMIEINRMDDKEGRSVHNFVIFTCEKGEQIFFATLVGDLCDGVAADGEYSDDEHVSVSVTSDGVGEKLQVDFTCNGSNVMSACGEYAFCGNVWNKAGAKDRVYIREGSYRHGAFKLDITANDQNMRFVITDGNNSILCETIMKVPSESSSVVIEKNGISVEIAAGISEGKLHMEVAGSYGEQYEFEGIYVMEE